MYRKWNSNLYEVKEIHNPLVGCSSKRIVCKASNCIVVRKSEIAPIIVTTYKETKGDGARKLKIHASHHYSGLYRSVIQTKLNAMKQPQKLRPLFQNKAPLRPVKACRLQERHRVDLVNMASMPATIDGDTYKYIMSVIDIFSRFVFLRSLQTKESSEVADNLLDIYNEHGPPEILQSDQGREFKGLVKAICEALNVRIINSAAYSPQTQGKTSARTEPGRKKSSLTLLIVKMILIGWKISPSTRNSTTNYHTAHLAS